MNSFLSQVAKVYIENESNNMCEYCFVFPNKRSGVFFSDYLSKYSPSATIMPQIVTISDFISEFSTATEASRLELMFIMYDEYKKIIQKKSSNTPIVEFDKFQFWAEMLLNDFNDVDKYLVDAKQLFININRLKEINSNFLTQEQIDVINYYWGENRIADSIGSFWKHISHDDKENLSEQFIKLWQILYDLYESFRQRLQIMGLCYSGMAYREVAETVKFNSPESLSARRYIFVGFNVLSTSEIKIFERLKAVDYADFYWDYNSPAFAHKSNRGTRFVGKYVNWFKSRYALNEKEIKEFPTIKVVGVPSNVGQVKETVSIISQLQKDNKISDVNTAIVLPDEGLFIPLLHSMPEEVKSVNITMGYPMRHTPVASLIGNVVSMQLRARVVHEKMQFFYEDILNVLSHPLVKSEAPTECREIVKYINEKRAFNITAEFFKENYSKLSPIFEPVFDLKNTNEVIVYIRNLVTWVKSTISLSNPVDIGFMDKYLDSLDRVEALISQYNVEMNETTVFHLVERAVGSETINFVGEPLKGLQVMGVLETRALDFENLIILSMNERVFPRKHYAKTFIPNALRRGYGMSTISFQESMYAYYFYRMISRAKNVYIMYDARTGGMRSGEMSRYLHQLKYLYNRENITFSVVNYDVLALPNEDLAVPKTPDVMEKLNVYKDPNSNRYLSASALNKYISCPLSFYLYYVEGIQHEDEITEYMDEGTYGTIMHEVAEKIYKYLKGDAHEVKITEKLLDSLKNRQGEIMQQITRSINYHYNKLGKDNDTPLHGDGKVIGEIMLHFTILLLENEKQFADFYFVDAEKRDFGQWKINDKHTINFKQIIDRIDKVKSDDDLLLRFVDYKTGSDSLSLDKLESLFDRDKSNRCKAIFQLFVYCLYYAYKTGYEGDIQPYIYSYRTINTEHLPPITIGTRKDKKVLNSYLEYKDEFWPLFEELINEIFDEKIPFVASTNEDACKYCKFLEFCNKEPKKS
ncbi:MAG: PD-(D/E)XK nuclease family protein [Muribaculaceae bacterium]|nr:PD-(D/E)XK nuclease family protein [Muribaculaceae bacterium]